MKHHIFGAFRACTVTVASLVGLFFIMSIVLAAPAMAEDEGEGLMKFTLSKTPEPLAKDVESSLDYLFAMLDEKNTAFDQAKANAMLDFVVGMQGDPKDIEPKRRFSGKGICLRKEVKTDLDNLLRYFYNPEIPNFLLCPAVLRYSGWHKGSDILTRERPLWDELPNLSEPVVIRGTEFESTSPDAFAEAYYRYDLKRAIILLKHNGKNVAISISEQADKSDVGRKGAILNDKEWEYFYSGIEGLNKGGISWMDTFMYKSASVQVFVEEDAAAKKSSVFLFKWLKAGWAGMNVVKRKHIYDGSLRYTRSMAKVLEASTMTPEELVDGMKTVTGLSDDEVNEKISEYAKNFEIRFKNDPKLEKKEYAKVIADGQYADVLDMEARKSILALQKLKAMMGMETLVNLEGSPVAQAPADPAAVEAEPES